MTDASESVRTADDAGEVAGAEPRVRPVGGLLVGAALVFAAAVLASSSAMAISIFDAESQSRLIEQLHRAAYYGVNMLHAGLLVGAALLLVAAEFHDVDSRWFPRAIGIVGGLACVAVAAGVFVALDVPSWNQSDDPMIQRFSEFSSSTSDRLVMALHGLSGAAIAACAVAACWLLATGRIDFGRGRAEPVGATDASEQVPAMADAPDLTDIAELARTVQWLRDKALIEALPQRYAHGLDTRQFEKARAVFRDDCTVKGSLVEAPIDPYWENLTPGVQAYQATMHFMGNQYVDVEPGADTGYVETYAVAYHMEEPGNGRADLVMGVRYCDDVARDGDGWLIVRRTAIPVWVRGPLPRDP